MSGKNWILLVAGSKDWENYKHQASVCLHYQILKRHGIPDEQIVVMMYDDIAYNGNNPSNGNILSVVDHLNVYPGVLKDYTRENVTPENFLAALQGENTTDSKVIKRTHKRVGKKSPDDLLEILVVSEIAYSLDGPNDNIYIFMCGVGQKGTFQFLEKTLHPKDLIETLKSMHDNRKFSKMVIYMDSNYSATMFEGLPNDVKVFALTSCNKTVETTPTDYDKERGVFLSDLFSSTWLKYLNTADFTTETFHDLVKTKQSAYVGPCPCQFGDTEITKCHLSEFLQN